MNVRELKQRLDEFPDDYEVMIVRSKEYPYQMRMSYYKTNLIIQPTDYNKKVYIT